ncbi:hypothetical protein ABH944_007775 [Caballeronia udeis]|uniref:Transcriptional coactivator p15 (PC4) C-terminal domain-containing protein n=1 Tax=Caballeronia udeis TaxID=1232866 RepID=A0ABW8MUT8_9BURK
MIKKTATPKSSLKDHDSADASSSSPAAQQHAEALFTIQRNAQERILIGVGEYRGHTFVSARIWYLDDKSEYRPTSRAITIRPSLVPQLIQALDLAARAIGQGGA